jgi:hypothetical protein
MHGVIVAAASQTNQNDQELSPRKFALFWLHHAVYDASKIDVHCLWFVIASLSTVVSGEAAVLWVIYWEAGYVISGSVLC